MKPKWMLMAAIVILCVGCSKNQGKLVEKSTPAESPGNTTIASASSGAELPPDHPPVMSQIPLQNPMGSLINPNPVEPPKIDGTKVTVAGLFFEIDPTWTSETPSSGMRAAQFRLPPAEGESDGAELVLFQGIGGSAQMNIDRWIGQFVQPNGSSSENAAKVSTREVNGLTVHTLDIQGTFKTTMAGPMMPASEKTGQRMLALVVEGPGGPWHFKLTGTVKTVSHWESAFQALVNSLKPSS